MKCKWGTLRTALHQTARRRFYCHSLLFSGGSVRLKRLLTVGLVEGKKKPADKQTACTLHANTIFFFRSPPLDRANRALNMQLLCHYCHRGCLSANHRLNALPPPPITGYHPECHTPTIEPEADSDSWICRQCVFAVSTKVRLLISLSHTFRKRARKEIGVQYGRNPAKCFRHACCRKRLYLKVPCCAKCT